MVGFFVFILLVFFCSITCALVKRADKLQKQKEGVEVQRDEDSKDEESEYSIEIRKENNDETNDETELKTIQKADQKTDQKPE